MELSSVGTAAVMCIGVMLGAVVMMTGAEDDDVWPILLGVGVMGVSVYVLLTLVHNLSQGGC